MLRPYESTLRQFNSDNIRDAECIASSVLPYGFSGVYSVVVCTSCCERESMSSILIRHPKVFAALADVVIAEV